MTGDRAYLGLRESEELPVAGQVQKADVEGRIVMVFDRACSTAGGRASLAVAAASAVAAADVTSACPAPKSWRSGAKQRRDAGHRATAAASGTVGSTFAEAWRRCRTTADHVRQSVVNGWTLVSWTAESGSLRSAGRIDD